MPANAAIYLPTDTVDLRHIYPEAKSDARFLRKPTYFEMQLGPDLVRYNFMPKEEISQHIRGFIAYLQHLDEKPERIHDWCIAIGLTQTVLGLVTNGEFRENHEIWESVFIIAQEYDGYVFVHDSLVLANGVPFIGPLRNFLETA